MRPAGCYLLASGQRESGWRRRWVPSGAGNPPGGGRGVARGELRSFDGPRPRSSSLLRSGRSLPFPCRLRGGHGSMAPKSLGLWMLFLWIQEGESTIKDCGNVTGILRKAVVLKCCFEEGLKPDRVQWQLQGEDECVVDARLPGQSSPLQCEHYRNRTELKENGLHLQLLSVTLEDSNIYECILQKQKNGIYQRKFQGRIRLELSANESENATYLVSPTNLPGTSDDQQQTQAIAISFLIALIVIITIIIFIFLYKRKHCFYRAYTAPVDMNAS